MPGHWPFSYCGMPGPQYHVRQTKAVTYLRVLVLERAWGRELEREFPEAFRSVRAAAAWKRARRILREAIGRPDEVAQLRAEVSGLSGSASR